MKRREFLGLAGSSVIAPYFLGNKSYAANRQKVVIFGAGVAGLTAAHELLDRGFDVEIFEKRPMLGGKARSFPAQGNPDLPAEHGFRFFPSFYSHITDTMTRIPFEQGTVYDNLVPIKDMLLSRKDQRDLRIPVRFPGGISDLKGALKSVFKISGIDIPPKELAYFLNRYWVFVTSCEQRRYKEYENISWMDFVHAEGKSEGYKKYLAQAITRNLVAAKGDKASARTLGNISFQLILGALKPNGRSAFVLNGPTSEMWIEPWVNLLKSKGLKINFGSELYWLHTQNGEIDSAYVKAGLKKQTVKADHFILALPPEKVFPLLNEGILGGDDRLKGIGKIQTEWMVGIQLYLGKDVRLGEGTQLYIDSPWAITAVSQSNFWRRGINTYSDAAQGILSVDVSNWDAPGILYGKTAKECQPEEIFNEVWAQLLESLDEPSRSELIDARVVSWNLDPGISFGRNGATANEDQLFINTPGTWWNRPTSETRFSNLFLAGDYIQTHTDLACMESANEAGRRAVNGILKNSRTDFKPCDIFPLREPLVLEAEKLQDLARFKLGLRNVHDY